MLEAALRVVNEVGLTVSLEHISLEDVIRDAGVSRSAVYRRWPYKDLFFSDLLRELAKAAMPAAQANPFGVEGTAEWSPVALAMTSTVLTYVEPDPEVVWDDERLARVRRELTDAQ